MKSANLKYYGAAAMLTLLLITAVFLSVLYNTAARESLDAPTPPPAESQTPPAALAVTVADTPGDELRGYLVRDDNGAVGVYTPDGLTLLDTLPIEPASLRLVDAERLLEGIVVESDQELARLIEDFSS